MQADPCRIGTPPTRRQPGRFSSMTKRTVFATAAAAFAVSTFAAAAHADYTCTGANACKGQSACKSGASACKGQNACKGQGFVMTGNSLECTVIKSK
jgi:hypothetical protein